MTILMALVDYIPVILFLIAAVTLQRGMYEKMSKGAFALFSAGSISVFVAGLFKATWKLLYAANICDFERLNNAFFPMQSTGFLLAGLGIVAMVFFPQEKKTKLREAAAPAVFSGTMIFVSLMVLGVLMMNGGLAVEAFRKKKKGTSVLFIIAFVMMLMMGYLSSRDFTKPILNWMGEVVNIVGQLCFLLGARGLCKSESN